MAKLKDLSIDGINIVDIIYPVGSVYLSLNNTPPSDVIGGVWEPLLAEDDEDDRFLCIANPSISASGETGGSKSHFHKVRLTLPFFYGAIATDNFSNGIGMYNYQTKSYPTSIIDHGNHMADKNNGIQQSMTRTAMTAQRSEGTTSSSTNQDLPPYIKIYAWKRTA